MRAVRLVATACLALVLAAAAAPAALTSDQFRCQNTVAKQGRKLFKKTFNFLAKCHDDISKGKLLADRLHRRDRHGRQDLRAQGKFDQQLLDKCPDARLRP